MGIGCKARTKDRPVAVNSVPGHAQLDAGELSKTPVILCVDALTPQMGGIGRYTWELCRRLPCRPDIGPLRFYARNQFVEDPSLLLTGGRQPRPGLLQRIYRRLGRGMGSMSGVVHAPNYFLPEEFETGVITVHDLSVFRFPETHPAARREAFAEEFERSLERASQIITDTATVRAEIIDSYGIAPDRVTAVHLGVDPAFHPRASTDLLPSLAPLGLAPNGYALCVSTLEPRKRIGELLIAWKGLPDSVRARFPLVLAGGAGWLNDDLLGEIEAGAAEGWLKPLGFVGEEALPALYAGAALFLYPSIYEGFGLPPLEAMASGVPVIVSNRSCMPEVAGGAAMEIDPDDRDAFARAIERGLTDERWRAEAVRRGMARAAGFTWDRCIEQTVEVYRRADFH